jgi:hypothetical protein
MARNATADGTIKNAIRCMPASRRCRMAARPALVAPKAGHRGELGRRDRQSEQTTGNTERFCAYVSAADRTSDEE